MANRIRLKFTQASGRTPNTSNGSNTNYIVPGELALNIYDKKIYTNYQDTLIELGPNDEANNVLFVSVSGSSNNDGKTLSRAKNSIKAAVQVANASVPTTIFVKAGTYSEENPIIVANNMTIIGDSPSSVIVSPQFATQDIFHLKSGSRVEGLRCIGFTSPAAGFAFPDIGTPSAIGSSESSAKEIDIANIDFTNNFITINNSGTGANLFSNGTCVVYSTTKANPIGGLSNNEVLYIKHANSTGFTLTKSSNISSSVANLTSTSSVGGSSASGNAHYFYSVLYVESPPEVIDCETETTTGTGVECDGKKCGGFRSIITKNFKTFNQGGIGHCSLNGGIIISYSASTICANNAALANTGGQVFLNNSRTSFGNNGLVSVGNSSVYLGGNVESTLTATTIRINNLASAPRIGSYFTIAGVNDSYFTVKSFTENAGNYTITISESIPSTAANNASVKFYHRSKIIADSHMFDQVGSGNIIAAAMLGTSDQTKEVVETEAGKVYFSSRDHIGNYRLGDGFVINNNGNSIEGNTFVNSLVTNITPFILAIGD